MADIFETPKDPAKANASLEEANVPLKISEKLPYMYATIGACGIWGMMSGMLTFYWTDVILIPAGAVSIFMLVSKLWDAVNDPIIGYLSDRTQTKYGRYRPWMLAFIPSAITGWLAFTQFPGMSQGANQILSVVMYLLYVLFFTMCEVPGNGLVAVATTDPKSRASIYSYRMGGSNVAGILLSATTLPMIYALGAGSNGSPDLGRGFFWVALIFAVIAFTFGFYAFFSVRERVKIPVSKHKMAYSFAALKGNGPFWVYFVAFIIYGWTMSTGSVRMYYWTYLAENQLGTALNQSLWGIGMAVGAIAYNFIAKAVKHKGKPVVWAFIGSGVANAILALFFLTPESSGAAIFGYHAMTLIQGCINGLSITAMYGVMPDITEYTQWKYKIRISGFLTSILNCSFKFGFAFGMSAFAAMIGAFGYVPNVAQTEIVKQVINVNLHWIPCVCLIIAGLVMTRYKIDNETYYKMLHEIAERDDVV
jgi:GPH family glycoside/pentoside/hexuronide:cation symporter/probable glucitol transport protein GutA